MWACPRWPATDELGFLRRQVLTSRNLTGPLFTGFLFGGLDTQIEHHLFPSMPRANLRRARTLVRPFCAERRIAYAEQSPWLAYREVLAHLRRAGTGRSDLGHRLKRLRGSRPWTGTGRRRAEPRDTRSTGA